MYFSLILIDNWDVVANPFLYFCKQRCVSPYLGMSSSILVELHKIGCHCCSASLSSAMWFFLPRAWLRRRNKPQWGFVKLHWCLTQTWCEMDDASPRWPIDAHGCASWLHRLVKLIDFQRKEVVFHQCSLLDIHKDDILHQFTFLALETQSSFMLVQFNHTIGYEPNVSSKKDRRWH